MDEIILILKEELSLAEKLLACANEQKTALKENLNGRAVSEATKATEAALAEIGAAEKKKEELLKNLGAETMREALRRQPYSREKSEAREYLEKLSETLETLKKVSAANQNLLAQDAEYLVFSMNVLANAQADPGYGGSEARTQSRKLFDESV